MSFDDVLLCAAALVGVATLAVAEKWRRSPDRTEKNAKDTDNNGQNGQTGVYTGAGGASRESGDGD